MGVWMIGTGSISIKPQVDEAQIKEFIQFTKDCFPEEYGEENFFEARGYKLEGEMMVIGECDPGFEEAIEKSEEKYQQWKMRML
ncbi:MAG: hypothetical protein ACI39H_00465 [Lachnospiraceae bacterium]